MGFLFGNLYFGSKDATTLLIFFDIFDFCLSPLVVILGYFVAAI